MYDNFYGLSKDAFLELDDCWINLTNFDIGLDQAKAVCYSSGNLPQAGFRHILEQTSVEIASAAWNSCPSLIVA
jgi:hypothetical protein